ncbi:MAG: hypothetical protein M9929_00865 [Burkholderiaceae bacterium]|nr:hypothetical protein [Burkholderiaceae bacterium]
MNTTKGTIPVIVNQSEKSISSDLGSKELSEMGLKENFKVEFNYLGNDATESRHFSSSPAAFQQPVNTFWE